MSLAPATQIPARRDDPLPLDEDGFLLVSANWNRELAQELAYAHGLGPLDATHWRMIEFVRDRYQRFGAIPPMRHLCRKVGVDRVGRRARGVRNRCFTSGSAASVAIRSPDRSAAGPVRAGSRCR